MKIGIILGSIRDDRKGESVARWVADKANGRNAEYELVDLKDYDVPLVTDPTPPAAMGGAYPKPAVQA